MSDLSRRNLLRGQWQQGKIVIRPPWIMSEAAFIAGCTRCQSCVKACETGVIKVGNGGFPELDFSKAECTFCGLCVAACQEAIFDQQQLAPWHYKAEINTACLTYHHIECRACHDSCEVAAIKFKLQLGGIAQPNLDQTICTGCGACIRYCPVKAIDMSVCQKSE